MSRILKRAFQIGVLLTLLIAPTQWSLEIKPKTFLSPADIVLALTAGVWFLKTLLEKRDIKGWLKLLPPWPHLLFVAVALLSLTVAADRASAVKDGVQLIEYFIVGAMLFDAFLREGGILARRLALGVSGLAFAIILLLALFQYIRTGGVESFAVRGTFGNRNVLGGYLALSLPLLFAGIFVIRTLPIRILFGLLLVIGLLVTLSGAAYLAIAIAILGLAAHAGWKVFLPTALPLIFFQVWILPATPRTNDLVHFDSLALHDENGEPERRYPDWQAAYSMALSHPDIGVGLGNYQRNIGQYYGTIERRTGPSEPDSQNLYLVLLATCGVAGLVAYLAILASGIGAAAKAALSGGITRNHAWLAAGVAAGLSAFTVTCIWHPLLVRGIGLPFVFLLILARHLRGTDAALQKENA